MIVGHRASTLSFVNADGATNYGVELEIRKNLSTIGRALTPFTVFANTTLMHSRIRPGNEGISSNTSSERPMQGQAAYVVNVGLSYASAGAASAPPACTTSWGAGSPKSGNFRCRTRTTCPGTWSISHPKCSSRRRSRCGSTARTCSNAPYQIVQGSVMRLHYTTGRVVSLGVTWTL